MSGTLVGEIGWDLVRDEDGHRDYTYSALIETSDVDDGPHTVLATPGMPAIGSQWILGNDNDAWAFAWPNTTITPHGPMNEPGTLWTWEQLFSTRPLVRCQTVSIDNPLNEPATESGSFVDYIREAAHDRFGVALKSSSHERFRGKAVEIEDSRPTVRIGFNVLSLPLGTLSEYMHAVNDATLWGLGPRKVKVARISWERKLYGVCTFYYTITYEFEIKFDTWDRLLIDEGTRKLAPGGDPTDPEDFVVAKDKTDENKGTILLDGSGAPLAAGAPPVIATKQLYVPRNLLLLGIPTSL